MSYSSNELNFSGGSSAHLNASYGLAGSAAASPSLSVGNRSVLKELNTNDCNNSVLSPLSSKASLSNSKLLNSSSNSITQTPNKTPTPVMAAGSASATATVFENNSSIHKFHIDPELEKGIFDEPHLAKELLNNSGGNKTANKFVGLTEFDEAKIPELPGDLDPNIEGQYNVTFEECFIPTLNAQQGIKVPEEFSVDKTHFLLPTESDAISSDIDTFDDCTDDRDPLATTFAADTTALDATTDLDSYRSAVNNTMPVSLNNTMENIADITMEAEGQPLNNFHQNQGFEQIQSQQFEPMDEDEPMDVDMNATMEIIHNMSNNIQHVERVLQHAENILENVEDKKPSEGDLKSNDEPVSMQLQAETSKMSFVVNTPVESVPNLEMELSKHELSLNKSIELPVNKSKTLSSECIIKSVNEEKAGEEEIKPETSGNLNLTVDGMNTSAISNSSAKSSNGHEGKTESKLNSTLGMNSSVSSQKNLNPMNLSNLSVKSFNSNEGKTEPNLNLTLDMITSMGSQKNSNPMNTSTTSNSSNKSVTSHEGKTESNLNITSDMINAMGSQKNSNTMNTSTISNSSAKALNSHEGNTEQNLNLTLDMITSMGSQKNSNPMNLSTISNSSVKSSTSHEGKTEPNVNLTLDMINSMGSQKNSDPMNTSTISNSSVKTGKTESNLNLTSGMSSSTNSQKSSAPTSPAFPSKPKNIAGFPRSAKAANEKPKEFTYLEKSDYLINQTQSNLDQGKPIANDLNGTYVDSPALNGTFAESTAPLNAEEKNKRFTFAVEPSLPNIDDDMKTQMEDLKNKRQTFSIDTLNEDKSANEKRRTFHVKSNESESSTLMQFPSVDKPSNLRRTFAVEDSSTSHDTLPNSSQNDFHSRRTFNVPFEDLPREDTSFEAMEVDDISQNTTLPMPANVDQLSQSPPLPTMQQRSQSPPLPTMQQRPQSPVLPTMQQRSQSPTHPTVQPRSQSPPLPTMQPRSQSPPLPNMQPRSQSPPLPTMQPRSQSPPLPTMQQRTKIPPSSLLPQESFVLDSVNIKQEQISPPAFESTTNQTYTSQPLPSLIQKRPSIRDARTRAAEILSAKEQSNIKVKDEKDIFVEKFTPSPIEDIFTAVSATSTTLTNSSGLSEFDQTSTSSCNSVVNNGGEQAAANTQQEELEDEFSGNNNLILNPSDFEYLLTKSYNTAPVDRSSLLLKFDPLLGVPVVANQGQQQYHHQQQLQQLQIPTNTNLNPCLSPTLEEDEHNDSNRSFVIDNSSTATAASQAAEAGLTGGASAKLLKERSQEVKQQLQLEQQIQPNRQRQLLQGGNKKNATMSVDVIKDMSLDNDCNKTFENSNSTPSEDKQINYKMDELEKKIKNEVLKTEDIEKKLKDAEQREEALIKRITEKDKTIAKMTGVIEAYEKAIAELIADKEQITQNYEKQLAEVKADRDSNYHHLTSLETTFSDLHVKYEKSKEMTCQLKESEEALQAEKRKNLENLHLQEQRYDKMKNHAMQQLEIANKKLESLTRDHAIETTKLKALLKKEEIARSSINEQLSQKTKENAELVKICDELISGQGS